jgi:mono/diheme cytochrome c family protein
MRIATWSLLSVVVVLFSACAGVPLPREGLADPGALLFNGYTKEEVFCFRCHNGDGHGSMRGPNLGDRVPGMTDAGIKNQIIEGKGMMPGFKGKISDDEIAQVAAWLHKTFPDHPPAGK